MSMEKITGFDKIGRLFHLESEYLLFKKDCVA
jgi:hypothetical protein